MSETINNLETEVQKVSIEELDNLLGMPGAESVMTPSDKKEESKPTFFSKDSVDMSFVDEPEVEEKEEIIDELDSSEEPDLSEELKVEVKNEKVEIDDIINEVETEDSESNAGRPKLDKEGMSQLTKELISEGLLTPFEGEEDFKDYTLNDYKELFNANFNQKAGEFDKRAKHEFFSNLPHELQYAAKYISDGGTDLKGLFSVLAKNQTVKELDISTEKGQESIARNYLEATNFGDEEDIQEQIEEWKDLGKLEDKVGKFKPKLDKMQESIVQKQLMEQEKIKKEQENASQMYIESVYSTLSPGELNGVKLDQKMQNLLYTGLVQPNYPSISGKPTNLFGHLIEKYQFVEPNHGLIAEALWLLADPKGYREKISSVAKNTHVEDTVKKLKTEQSNRISSSGADVNAKASQTSKRGLQKPSKNFFKRK